MDLDESLTVWRSVPDDAPLPIGWSASPVPGLIYCVIEPDRSQG